jgi:hypothetical protein
VLLGHEQSSVQVKEEDSSQQDSDVDSLEQEIMEVEMRNQLGRDLRAEHSNDGADTPASSSTTEDRKRPAPPEVNKAWWGLTRPSCCQQLARFSFLFVA